MANGPLTWYSKKQATVALSTAEAEYVSISQATCDGLWLRGLLAQLGFPIQDPMVHVL